MKRITVVPKESFYSAGYEGGGLHFGTGRKFPWAVKKGQRYQGIIASNQPHYKERGLIFIGELLLAKGEYYKPRRRR